MIILSSSSVAKKLPVFLRDQDDILARQQDVTRHGTRFLIAQMHDCFFLFLCVANVGWHDTCLVFFGAVTNNLFHNHTSFHRSWTLWRRIVLWLRPPCGPTSSVSQLASFQDSQRCHFGTLKFCKSSSSRRLDRVRKQRSSRFSFSILAVTMPAIIILQTSICELSSRGCLVFGGTSSVVGSAAVWSANSSWAEFSESSVGKTVNGGNEALARIVFQSPVEMQNHMVHFPRWWCWRGRTFTWTVWPVVFLLFAQWWIDRCSVRSFLRLSRRDAIGTKFQDSL